MNSPQSAPSPTPRVTVPQKPVTRRRGACHRCRARKVRCDGKSSCTQCQRLGYECRYPPSGRARGLSPGKNLNLRTPIASHERHLSEELPTDHDSVGTYFSAERAAPLPLLDSVLLGDIMTLASGYPEEHLLDRTVTSYHSRRLSTSTTGPPHLDPDNGNLWRTDVFSDMEMENGPSSAITDEPFTFGVLSDTTQVTPTFATPLEPTFNYAIDTRETVSSALDFASADKTPQHELIKDALLHETQDYCNQQQRGQPGQNADLVRAVKKLLWGDIYVYQPRITEQEREQDSEPPRVHREFALDCIDACLQDSQGIAIFSDHTGIETAMVGILDPSPDLASRSGEPRGPPLPRQGASALAHVVLAVGAHILRAEGRRDDLPSDMPLIQFQAALRLQSQIAENNTFSLVDFQAYFAARIVSPHTSRLVSSAIRYVQVMRLGRHAVVDKACPTYTDRQQTKRAVWFLYALEKEVCLRAENFPVLDHDFIDYKPPPATTRGSDFDWLASLCRYGSLCEAILRESLSQQSLCARRTRRQSISHLESYLEGWVQSLPSSVQAVVQNGHSLAINPNNSNAPNNLGTSGTAHPSIFTDNSGCDGGPSTAQERRIRVTVFFQHHEALMAIHATTAQQQQQQQQPYYAHQTSHSATSTNSAESSSSARSATHRPRWSLSEERLSGSLSTSPDHERRRFSFATAPAGSGSRSTGTNCGEGRVDNVEGYDGSSGSIYSAHKRALSARKVLAASCCVSASDAHSHPHLYRVVCVAACALLNTTLTGTIWRTRTESDGHFYQESMSSSSGGDRRDLSYLATAAGFWGRMVLADIEGPLEEITEVVRLAQQAIKERWRH
ncbi:hypothetical protein B0T25DRAFT_540397 [Lasiosphaeria hispida]|uniref:Zn(2)-C6 fungal-type domain-containing protein n=1 Tax=Lasiosphaeria hispida TaxID=260671 RepID=A0AAJ0HMY6_9PEZI|nr:hypothetical protein B0T25DRAFT_540397 [Lasiosphaeria hispida]